MGGRSGKGIEGIKQLSSTTRKIERERERTSLSFGPLYPSPVIYMSGSIRPLAHFPSSLQRKETKQVFFSLSSSLHFTARLVSPRWTERKTNRRGRNQRYKSISVVTPFNLSPLSNSITLHHHHRRPLQTCWKVVVHVFQTRRHTKLKSADINKNAGTYQDKRRRPSLLHFPVHRRKRKQSTERIWSYTHGEKRERR